MTVTIKDHKGGMYKLFDQDGKTFVRSLGRYNFSGCIVEMESSARIGGKLSIVYNKNGLYGDSDSSESIFESGIITEITVTC